MRLYSKILSLVLLCLPLYQTAALDTVAVKKLYPGIYYYHITTPEPLSIHLLEVNMNYKSIKLELGVANFGLNTGGQRTSDFVKEQEEEGTNVIAAVNCDFFGGPGEWQAENSMIANRTYIKGAKLNRTMMAVTENNKSHIGDFQFDGYILARKDTIFLEGINLYTEYLGTVLYNEYWNLPVQLKANNVYYSLTNTESIRHNDYTEFAWHRVTTEDSTYRIKDEEWLLQLTPHTYSFHENFIRSVDEVDIYLGTKTKLENIYTLFGGLPGLVKERERPQSYSGAEGLTSERFIDKNPRTAIGYTEDKSKLYIAVVDGRQPELSAGMTLYELADYMISLGCYDVLNLDGGGSSTMVVGESVVNSPSDRTGERPVFNMLYLVGGD